MGVGSPLTSQFKLICLSFSTDLSFGLTSILGNPAGRSVTEREFVKTGIGNFAERTDLTNLYQTLNKLETNLQAALIELI